MSDTADTSKTNFRHIDPAGPSQVLCENAERLYALLTSAGLQSKDNFIGILDDVLGCIYALIFAREWDFQDRNDRQIEVDKVLKRAHQLSKGEVKTDGKWMAGFQFNNAL